jgi:hypothetical protein
MFEVPIFSGVLCINVFYLPTAWGDLIERDYVENISVEGR